MNGDLDTSEELCPVQDFGEGSRRAQIENAAILDYGIHGASGVTEECKRLANALAVRSQTWWRVTREPVAGSAAVGTAWNFVVRVSRYLGCQLSSIAE